ncbi:hypothetical protein MCC02031_16070 [Bifidobacteriaceae bacterium MCC02031]|nr:hypothetical protein MCC02031_16070 [Bifidobacteriaceae bacterium MCC02031]
MPELVHRLAHGSALEDGHGGVPDVTCVASGERIATGIEDFRGGIRRGSV